MLTFLVLVNGLAHAEATENGMQAAIYKPAIDFARDQIKGQTFHFDLDDVDITSGCYDHLGIKFFNLDVPVQDLDLQFASDGSIEVNAYFDTISGTDMQVYGTDSDYLDACIEFNSDVKYATLENGHLSGRFKVAIVNGVVDLTWAEEPVLEGDLDTDVNWFPDDIALFFFEDAIIGAVSDSIGTLVPDVVSSASVDALQNGNYGDFDVALALDDVSIDTTKLAVAAQTTIGWGGSSTCGTSDYVIENKGRAPNLDFGDGDGSAVAIGLTESMANELLQVAWRDGFFCFDDEAMGTYLDSIRDQFDASVGGLGGSAFLSEPAEVTIESDGIHLSLKGFNLDVNSTLDGTQEDILKAQADMSMVLDLEINQSLTSFTASVHDLKLDIHELDANHLLAADRDLAAQHLVDFLEGWVTEWAESKLQDITLYASMYNAYGVVIRVDEIAYETGGLRLYASIFDENDPEVDTDPPETGIQVVGSNANNVDVELTGEDNRSDSMAYSWKLDDKSWSAWTDDSDVKLEGVTDGHHQLRARTRDAWLNIDNSPAELQFDLSGGALVNASGDEPAGACGCSSSGPSKGSGVIALFAFAAMLAGRRRSV